MKHRAPLEKLRAEIAAYADRLETDQRRPATPLEPKPVFNFGNLTWSAKESGPVKSNLCLLPAAALSDLSRVWMHSFSNEVRLDNGLGDVFGLLSGSHISRNDEAAPDLEAQVQGLSQACYIGLYKDREYTPAKLGDDKTFVPAVMGGDVWLFDRSTGQLVFHGLVLARNSERVSVMHDRMRSLSKDQWQAELFKDVKENFLRHTMLVLQKNAGVEFRNWTPPAPETDAPGTPSESPRSNQSEVLRR